MAWTSTALRNARFEGLNAGAQLRVFDEALRGLVLTGPQAASIERARAHIREGWNDPEAAAEDPLSAPTSAEEQATEGTTAASHPGGEAPTQTAPVGDATEPTETTSSHEEPATSPVAPSDNAAESEPQIAPPTEHSPDP